MAFLFTKLPFSSLILRLSGKLEATTSKAYVDLVKMLDERETKLSNSFDQIANGADGTFTTVDSKTVTVKNGIIISIV